MAASASKVTKLETAAAAPPPPSNRVTVAFEVGDRQIDTAIVRPLSYAALVKIVVEARELTSPATWEGKLKRVRLLKQVEYQSNGSVVALSTQDVLRMPIKAAREIAVKLDENDGKPGKVVRPGDGIDKAITFELGTPLPGGQGKPPISELEFLAKTYGDIEDVLAASDQLTQVQYLLAIAKPLGPDVTLTALPSWALDRLTAADGLAIGRDVLPHFLGSPVESQSE